MFTDDTEVALASAAALINTAGDVDLLTTVAALDDFISTWGWTGSRRRDRHELDAVRDVRGRLDDVWATAIDGGDEATPLAATTDSVVRQVNHLLSEFDARPHLVKHDGWDYHLHATEDSAPLEARLAVEAAMALVDVIRAGELSRLRRCDNLDCSHVFVDLSRNRSKRYCDVTCTNRAAARAFRARA